MTATLFNTPDVARPIRFDSARGTVVFGRHELPFSDIRSVDVATQAIAGSALVSLVMTTSLGPVRLINGHAASQRPQLDHIAERLRQYIGVGGQAQARGRHGALRAAVLRIPTVCTAGRMRGDLLHGLVLRLYRWRVASHGRGLRPRKPVTRGIGALPTTARAAATP